MKTLYIKNYDADCNKGYILTVDVEYPKNLHDLYNDLPFLPEKMKINKYRKPVYCLYDKNNYVGHIGALKHALDHRLILKKVHRVIQLSEDAWLKEYIDMNTELRKLAKNEFEKYFFQAMNNCVFGKTMENVRNHRDIKLVTEDKRRNQLVSEPIYWAIKGFSENLVSIEMKKTKVKMNKPIYLGFSILDLKEIVMYELWFEHMKPKCACNVELYYMDTDSFMMHIKTEDFYKDIADDVEKRFDTSTDECDRPLPKGKNKKVIGLMKDDLGGKIMKEFVALRPKTYSYLMDDESEGKKAKETKKCVIKKILKFNNYKDCFLNSEIILKTQKNI